MPPAPGLPRGGYKQKAAWCQAAASPSEVPSELARLLVHEWSWGNISTPFVQKIAAAAVKDGMQHRDIQILGQLGTCGRYPNHMHQELMAKLKPSKVSSALTLLDVEYQAKHVLQHALLPHEMFATL